jgi:hypothetical protein
LITFTYGEDSVPIHSFAEYPRDSEGFCAFCHGDPLAEHTDEDTPIGRFWKTSLWAETCPCCEGRPS